MFCTKCGEQLEDDALFCIKCGAQIVTLDNGAKIFIDRKNNNGGSSAAKASEAKAPETAAAPVSDNQDVIVTDPAKPKFSAPPVNNGAVSAPAEAEKPAVDPLIASDDDFSQLGSIYHGEDPIDIPYVNPANADSTADAINAALAAEEMREEEEDDEAPATQLPEQTASEMIDECGDLGEVQGGFGNFDEDGGDGDLFVNDYSGDEKGGKKGKKALIAIIIAVVLLLVAAAIVLYMNRDKILNSGIGRDETTTQAVEAGMKEYDLGGLVTFAVPENWSCNDSSTKLSSTFYFYNENDPTKPLMIACTGILGTISAKDDPSNIIKTYLGKTEYTYSSEGTCKAGDGTGFLFSTDSDSAGMKVLVFSASGRSITMTYYNYAKTDDYSEFEKIMNSIVLAEKSEEETEDDSDMVTVPDFTGFTQETIEQNSAYSEYFKFTFTEEESGNTAGIIFRQSVKAGSEVAKGTTIELYIAKAKEEDTVEIEDFSGYVLASAKKALEDLGLEVKVEYYPNNGTHPEGTVEDSDPIAGSKIAKGSQVTLFVWDEVETTTEEPTTKAPETTKEETTKAAETTTKASTSNNTTGTYKITSDIGLRMRDSAGTGGNAIVTIPYGTSVTVTEVKEVSGATNETKYWGKVTYNGQTGWVAMYYLGK